MNEVIAKLTSIVLCLVIIADVSAVASVNLNVGSFNGRLEGLSKTIWVDDDFVDDPPNHKWDTIQEGVDDADRGDTVYVYNGTYYENVQIRKIISLIGENRKGAIIDGGAKGSTVVIGPGVNRVVITGFTITNGICDYHCAGITISQAKKITIEGNIISSNSMGIRLHPLGYNTIANNTIADNRYSGVYLDAGAHNNIVSGNNISNSPGGIVVITDHNVISSNNISSTDVGVVVLGSGDHNVISGNNVSNSHIGIHLNGLNLFPSSNTISNNTILDISHYGILVEYSIGNTIVSNVMMENGIILIGPLIEHWNTHTIDTSNTVNGKPVYYWKNITGGTIPSGAGEVILANCTDVLIENQNVSIGAAGIELGFSSMSTIANNTASLNKWIGVFLYSSNNNIIDNNTASSNDMEDVLLWLSNNNTVTNNAAFNCRGGISLRSSNGTIVANNSVSDNWFGISLWEDSDNNTIANNNASSNSRGILLSSSGRNAIANNTLSGNNLDGIHFLSSDNNTIAHNAIGSNNEYGVRFSDGSVHNRVYHNNFIDNTKQALDTSPAYNDWHNPILLEGNYWSDYAGVDDGSGTGKHAIAGDLIGDTLIPHPVMDFDFYPCMVPDCLIGPGNTPPVADAGPDQTVYVGDVVQFDGSGSNDPDAGWVNTTVDTLVFQNVAASMALDSHDNPAIAYTNVTEKDLKFAKWNGTLWEIETVDSLGYVGGAPSLAFNGTDYPSISYFDWGNLDLKFAQWNGTGWENETIDSVGTVGTTSSLAFDKEDKPHISYFDYSNQDLKHAWWNGTAWLNETVDWHMNVGSDSYLAFDRHGNPHISYAGEFQIGGQIYKPLKYAWKNGSLWDIQFVSLVPSVASFTSLALDRNDSAHISYFECVGGKLKYAFWNGTAWMTEILDYTTGPIVVGGHTSIALDSVDYPHVSYADGKNGTVKHTFWNGTAWTIETVDSATWDTTSIAIDSNDNPHISYFSSAKLDLKYAKKGGGIVAYDWDFDDGSPHGSGERPAHVYSNPGIYNVTLSVTDKHGATDTDNCIITVLPRNRPPVADANGPYDVDEGSPITLDGSDSYDPDGDTLQYRWDLNNDGIWDTGWSSSPHFVHTWGDDYSGDIVLQVSDGEFTDTDTATITVRNVAPSVELRMLAIYVNVSLRITGEKWHDVSVELYEDDVLMAEGNLVRYPGSPNDQMLDLASLEVNISRRYSAIVRYTPEDDPINGQPLGANPCWIILTFDDGEEIRLHHAFNVRHPETYVWEVDLTREILLHGLTFEATAYDPGADDLVFHWDFGDGTSITCFFPNDNGTFPVEIVGTVTHAFLSTGTYTVTLTVEDDDGGVGVAVLDIVIP